LNEPADITDNSLKLSWTETVEADFKNYTIYQSNEDGILGTPIHTITDKATILYTVAALSPDTTYYFTLRVNDEGGLYADSNQVSGKTGVPAPFPWTTIIIASGAAVAAVIIIIVFMKKKKII
jgi:hypothetical protein